MADKNDKDLDKRIIFEKKTFPQLHILFDGLYQQ